MHKCLPFLLVLVGLTGCWDVLGQQSDSFREKITQTTSDVISKDDLKKYRNYLYKKLYRWNSQQNYVSPPFGEWHVGNQNTHRNYLLSADINPHFFLFNDARGSLALDITPRFLVRILRDSSYSPRDRQLATWDRSFPVRTPSYLPGGTIYFADWSLAQEPLEQFRPVASRSDRYLPYRYYSLSLFHHSNGQDGSHTDPNRPPNRVFNIYNGNFSIELISEAGVTWGDWKKGGQTPLDDLRAGSTSNYHNWDRIRSLYVGIEHILSPGESLLIDCKCYGLAKLHLRGQLIDVAHYNEPHMLGTIPDSQYEKQRFIVDISLGSNKFIGAKPGPWRIWPNVEFRYHWGLHDFFRSNTTSAFIAAGYQAQDGYNVYLEDSFPFVQVGLVMGFKVHNDNRDVFMDGLITPAPQQKRNKEPKP